MCGVFGIRSEDRDIARLAYFGALRAPAPRPGVGGHRRLGRRAGSTVVRDMGLVTQVFNGAAAAQALRGEVGDRAHCRYSTTGANALGERAADHAARARRGRSRSATTGTS